MRKNNINNDYCEVPHCRHTSDIIYYGKGLCNGCHGRFTVANLKEILKVE